jgi:hypothetical protein
MNATLYRPEETPESVDIKEFTSSEGNTQVIKRVAELLGCAPQLVDILASGPTYTAYSIFDCEGRLNPAAMQAVSKVAGVIFDLEDEDSVLRGAVLVVITDGGL